jgi:peroxiredoxin
MRQRFTVLLGVGVLAVLACGRIPLHGDEATSSLGKAAPSFALSDQDGKKVALGDFKGRKAIVLLFLGTECPINNAFLPRLAELSQVYGERGVQFLGLNANRQDTPQRIRDHARRYGIPFPVLRDEGAIVADQLGARRTPEVFVLDGECKVRYQGRIDDQFGIGFNRGKPSRNDLAEALDELLAGKPVSQPTTPVAGCIIGRAQKPRGDGSITFTNQVARILQKNCQECHRPTQIGPMALLSYDDAVSWAEMIREVVRDDRMPPWHADPKHGVYRNDRRMSPEDRATLLQWIELGCPRGDEKDLPPPRQYVEGWRIGKPDVVFTMPVEYDVPAKGPKAGIPYRYFEVETKFDEDRWVERAEARPGASEVVHHIIVFIVPPGLKFNARLGNAPVLCGTAPGDMPLILQPGKAKLIPKGSKLVFQMHYTPNGRALTDRSSVGITFAKSPPTHRVHVMPITTNPGTLVIPPGDDNYKAESAWTFREDGYVLSWMPHMHLRGKDFLVEAEYPDGKKETLLSIPRYDFNWQSVYRYAEPKFVPKGTRIHCVAHFDNSAKNPNNPDPTVKVRWGDQTWEEMMIGWMDFVYATPMK